MVPRKLAFRLIRDEGLFYLGVVVFILFNPNDINGNPNSRNALAMATFVLWSKYKEELEDVEPGDRDFTKN